MTYEEILGVITGSAKTEEEEKEEKETATRTDAINPNEVHDNSDVGAGEGPAEGGDAGDEGDLGGGDEGGEGGEGGE